MKNIPNASYATEAIMKITDLLLHTTEAILYKKLYFSNKAITGNQ